ncbi:MAG: 50S ribosomal protein L3 [bacterium]|nr:50S ribosomal protein L3 [bacterium]
MNAIYGFKVKQDQSYTPEGLRIPVTHIKVEPNVVVGKDLVALGHKKSVSKPWQGMINKLTDKISPRFMRKLETEKTFGENIKISDVFSLGDNIKVSGISKGKGFAGGVKRHGFKGGPKTHGQSDRQRAPGSIGQSTTPGRVYKGKRMAGHMGVDNITVKNLKVVEIKEDLLIVKGLVPGYKGTLLKITKS